MKDNHHAKIREQYEEKLTNFENERKTLEEKLENIQSIEQVLRTECNDAELTEVKGQLDLSWNQTHCLTDLSPLSNILTRDLSEIKVLSNNLKTLTNSPALTVHLVSVDSDSDGDMGDCVCRSHSSIKKSTKTTGLISVDVTENKMTNSTSDVNNISSCNRLANLHKEIAQAYMKSNQSIVNALPCEVSNDKCVENPSTKHITQSLSASLITENTEKKNLERIRTLLIAELTSLELLHSMFDLTISSLTKTECTKESMCVPLQNKSNLEEFTEKEDDRHSSSTPSGYETGSHRGSQVDIIHCNNDDANTSEYFQDSDEEKINNETVLLLDQITDNSVSSTISSSDMDLHSVNVDSISLLHKEIHNQRKNIDEELVKMLCDMIGYRILDWDNRIRKRDIYCHLVRILTDSNASRFDIDQLEQIFNLVLVDHSITGCLLTLSHREKAKDIEKLLLRLSTFESVPRSISDHSDERKYFNYDNDTTEVNSSIPYVSPSNITAALTTMQMVTDNEIKERVEGDVNKPGDDCKYPTQQRKGLSRFLCLSVSSIRRPKKRKSSKIVLAKEN